MSILDKIKPDLIYIIEWINYTSDTLIWKFPHNQLKIKNGAQLIVNENQVAVLVNKKQFADIYYPGNYRLTTNNIPILATQKGWKYNYKLPFKVNIYFVNTKQFLNLQWNTTFPITIRDNKLGLISFHAFGSYCFHIKHDPTKFIYNIINESSDFTNNTITEQLNNFVVTKLNNYITESKINAVELITNLSIFSEELTLGLQDDFSNYGINLTKFVVSNVSITNEVEQAIQKYYNINNNLRTKQPTTNIIEANSNYEDTLKTNQIQTSYYVAINKEQKGPYNIHQLKKMTQQGQLKPQTLVWTIGMKSWAAANTISALSKLFYTSPPPL